MIKDDMLIEAAISDINLIQSTSKSNEELLIRLKEYFNYENTAWVVYQKLINKKPLQ